MHLKIDMAAVRKLSFWWWFCSIHLFGSVLHTAINGQMLPSTSWCVARSDASDQALQAALDYACSAGADCTPIQPTGLCFLPNTLLAHASYAFDSFFQRKAMAAGTCSFAGTATVAKTDPSYGSCVYPSSFRAAGGAITPGSTGTPGGGSSTVPTTYPYTIAPPPPAVATFYGNGGGSITPGMGTGVPTFQNSKAALQSSVTTALIFLPLLLAFQAIYEPK